MKTRATEQAKFKMGDRVRFTRTYVGPKKYRFVHTGLGTVRAVRPTGLVHKDWDTTPLLIDVWYDNPCDASGKSGLFFQQDLQLA